MKSNEKERERDKEADLRRDLQPHEREKSARMREREAEAAAEKKEEEEKNARFKGEEEDDDEDDDEDVGPKRPTRAQTAEEEQQQEEERGPKREVAPLSKVVATKLVLKKPGKLSIPASSIRNLLDATNARLLGSKAGQRPNHQNINREYIFQGGSQAAQKGSATSALNEREKKKADRYCK